VLKCTFESSIFAVFAWFKPKTSGQTVPRSDWCWPTTVVLHRLGFVILLGEGTKKFLDFTFTGTCVYTSDADWTRYQWSWNSLVSRPFALSLIRCCSIFRFEDTQYRLDLDRKICTRLNWLHILWRTYSAGLTIDPCLRYCSRWLPYLTTQAMACCSRNCTRVPWGCWHCLRK